MRHIGHLTLNRVLIAFLTILQLLVGRRDSAGGNRFGHFEGSLLCTRATKWREEEKNIQKFILLLQRSLHGGDSRTIKQVQRHHGILLEGTIVLGYGFSTDTCNHARLMPDW